MDTLTILEIVGVIASVISGAWGIYVYLIRGRYPGHITLVVKDSIGLFDLMENWKELEILCNREKVQNNLVLLIGVWFNTGSIDITRDMAERKLAIKLPQGYKWLDAKIITTLSEVRATAKPNAKLLEFDFQLFKCDEHIRFEALVEAPSPRKGSKKQKVENPGSRLADELKVDYRIQNTRKCTIENPASLDLAFKTRMRKSAMASAVVLASCFALSFMWLPPKHQDITYLMRDDLGREREVKLDFSAPGSDVRVLYVSSGLPATLPLAEVKRRGYTTAPPPSTWSSFVLPFILIVILAPTAVFSTSFYLEKKRRKQSSKRLASCEPSPPISEEAGEY